MRVSNCKTKGWKVIEADSKGPVIKRGGEGGRATKREGEQVKLYPYKEMWGGGFGRKSSDHAEVGVGAQQVLR